MIGISQTGMIVVFAAGIISGLGVLFVVAGAFTDGLLAKLKSIGRIGRGLRMFADGVMILLGGATLTGQLSAFSHWLLDTFPLLATIG